MSKIITVYDSPHQFEPLLPQDHLMGPLLERAGDLSKASIALGAAVAPGALGELRKLLRSMNSYYTNRIESDHTRPTLIERALRHDYSSDTDLARKQRLAVAHIRAEEACEADLSKRRAAGQGAQDLTRWLYSTETLEMLHGRLFAGLPQEDLRLQDGTLMQPGVLRHQRVSVGIHEAPTPGSVPAFLNRWGTALGQTRRGEASVIALIAAHHRLAWVHPFPDGNGRVARLHTHLLLHAQGLTNGLWSPLRGFARSEERYRSLLKGADEHRRGDLDGRGNLTEAGLLEWIDYTLSICMDQVEFMSKQLDIRNMRQRMEAALTFDKSAQRPGIRLEALNALHYLFIAQTEMGRAEFKTMTGLGDRVGTQAISDLLKAGYIATDSPYGALRFAVPRHALRFYFPALWPEAEQDQLLIDSDAEPQNDVILERGPSQRM